MSGAWNNLTMREKAGFIKIGVDNGLTSLSDIQSAYNKFAEGGAFSNKQVRKFGDGGTKKKYETTQGYQIKGTEFVDNDALEVDQYGNVLNPYTGGWGSVLLPTVNVTPANSERPTAGMKAYVEALRRTNTAYNNPSNWTGGQVGAGTFINDKPLESVSPEFDLISLGQGLGLRNLIKRGIGSAAKREALAARGIPTSFKELSFSPEVSKDLLKEYKQIYKRNILNPELLQKVMDYTGLSMEEIIQMQSKNFYKALLNTNSKKVKYLLGDPESFGASKEFDIGTALKIYNENAQNVLRTTQGQSAFLGNNYDNIFEVSDLPLDQTSLPLEDVPYFISYHGGDTGVQELGKFVLPKDPLYDNARRLLTDQGFYTSPNLEVAEGYTSFNNPAVYHVPIFGKPYFTDLGGVTEIRPSNWGMIENPRISSIPESVFTALKEKGYDYIYSPWQSEMVQNNPALLKALKGSNGNFNITDPSSMFHALGGHIYDGETEDTQQIETTKPSIIQKIKLGLANLDNEVLGRALLAGQALLDTNPNKRKDAKYGLTHGKEDLGKGNDIYYLNGLPQSTFLLPEWERQILFENAGWHRLPNGNYNLVNKEASKHGRALPTYQSGPDAIDRNQLTAFGNLLTDFPIVKGDYELPDANSRPSTLYIGPDNKIYVREEDLNDYSNIGLLGRALDKVGNPLVVTTGIQPYIYGKKHIDMQDLFNAEAPGAEELDRYMQNQGLRRERINGKWQFVTPDVTVTP